MRENLLTSGKTAGIIISELMMMSSVFKGAHLLLEGEDDSQFWKIRTKKEFVNLVNCECKRNLIGAAALAIQNNLDLVLGIYDPDCDRHLGIAHHPKILIQTDENDLEATLLASEALDHVLHEYGNQEKIARFRNEQGVSVAEHLCTLSSHFGKLRYINQVYSHEVNFDHLSPYRFVSSADWQLDITGLQSKYSELADIDLPTLQVALEMAPKASGWNFSQGHDCIRILCQGLKQVLSNRQISEHDLCRSLRLAYSADILRRSKMYESVAAHETSNSISILIH